MMIGGENSDSSLPIDLINDILSRLPAKSIARCRCVSKLWRTMLLCPYFNDLFRTRSLARPPRLLFAVERFDDWCFFTSPYPQNIDEKPCSLVADFHMKRPGVSDYYSHASGFIHFCHKIRISEDKVCELVVCNPSTGQYLSLPLPESVKGMNWHTFLGFDPIDKQFKILMLVNQSNLQEKEQADQILTLGTGNDSWRKIHSPLTHSPRGEGICIDGVLYYLASEFGARTSMIGCFDVRSEKFKLLHKDFDDYLCSTKLINYKGKLGVISLLQLDDGRFRLCRRVREDDEYPKSKWSEYLSWYLDGEALHKCSVSIAGLTATGEIVLCTQNALKPFYVFYINPKRHTVQSVEIQGLRPDHSDNHGEIEYFCVKVFTDHVEDLSLLL